MADYWRDLAAWWSEDDLEAWCLRFQDTWARNPSSPNAEAFKKALRWIDAHQIKGDLEEARAELRKEVRSDPWQRLAKALGRFRPAANLHAGASDLNPDPVQREKFRKAARSLGLMNESGEWIEDGPLREVDSVLRVLDPAKQKGKVGARKNVLPWSREKEAMAKIRKLVAVKDFTVKDAAREVAGPRNEENKRGRRLAQLFEKKQSIRK